MKLTISHDWESETIKAKARWFRSLRIEERIEVFCAFTNLALEVNPGLAEEKHARPAH